jgi:hypothetical protein
MEHLAGVSAFWLASVRFTAPNAAHRFPYSQHTYLLGQNR